MVQSASKLLTEVTHKYIDGMVWSKWCAGKIVGPTGEWGYIYMQDNLIWIKNIEILCFAVVAD